MKDKIFSEVDHGLMIPKYSAWKCCVFSGMVLRPLDGREPNRFWRFMQYLAFGFVWTKDEAG